MNTLLLSEDELLLKNMVRELADAELAPRAAQYDESSEFPWANIKRIAELGLFGLTIDEEYGGSGGTTRQLAIVIEEIARACAATSVIYIAHLSLCTQFIQMFGTNQQKQQFIPPLAKGEKIGAFALSEPGSGSDSGAMQTTATKAGTNYKLNGSKLFITNGKEADIFIVMASHDLNLRTRGVNSFIVESGSDGFNINPQRGKMGIRASSTAELIFDNCIVSDENRLGDEGEGFRETMHVLNASRIGIAAQCVGIAQAAYEAATSYAKQRKAFGQHLADFQGIQWIIAEMATKIDAARLLVHRAATLRDANLPFVTEASMAKLFASKIAVESANEAMQIHGGVGYFSPTPVERYFRDAKVTEIYEGTSEIQKLIIARDLLLPDQHKDN